MDYIVHGVCKESDKSEQISFVVGGGFFFLYSMLITQKVLFVSLQDLQEYPGCLWNTLKILSVFYPKKKKIEKLEECSIT